MKKLAVLGIGKSGISAARWAVKMDFECVLSDKRPKDQWPKDLLEWCEAKGVVVDFGEHSEDKILTSDVICPSPGIPHDIPILEEARRLNIPIVGEACLGVSLWKGPKIGITGTNGKTTVTTLVGQMLKESGVPVFVGGNIGNPILEQVDSVPPGTVLVAEISSFQLDLFPWERDSYQLPQPVFDVAVLLNVAQDHLERYEDFDAYAKSKARIFQFQDRSGWAITGEDELALLKGLGVVPKARTIVIKSSSLGPKTSVLTIMWPEGGEEDYDLSKVNLPGEHNISNLYAAITASRLMGAKISVIQRVIERFKLPKSRLELVKTVKGVKFINDSKATNLHATLAAIRSIDAPIVLIAGGLGKGQDFSLLREQNVQNRVKAAVLMGSSAEDLKRSLGNVPCFLVNGKGDGWQKMEEAVKLAFSKAEDGDVVLLSPACASFDLFGGYEERGEAFRDAVKRL
ncbi:UDP-N-acetylmuramoylalanine--D-glutamate ligase [Dissulfuribacter thermophilus]|uniref:UDP-N-acetylmuramoylalanine--D-glutamate ligase n=2 Tax=Dissulfuribacter thermophilus TaxID=1156395 RepID=A0A1B9F4T0_9BACT|nr:UDP-N-acetylmuramoylalanine--D-glutamate ligase [Dissulfuribacter thermophilus]